MASTFFIVSQDIAVLKEFCAGVQPYASKVVGITFSEDSDAATCGADQLYTCTLDDSHGIEDFAKPIAELVRQENSAVVLILNNVRGRMLSGKLGVYLDAPVFTGINTLSSQDNNIVFRRIVYGGTAQRQEYVAGQFAIATATGGIFEGAISDKITSNISPIPGEPEVGIKVLSKVEKKEATVNLAAAKRIIDVGRGWKQIEDLEIPKKLAAALDAEVGCSRPVAENNKWMPKSCYMGITGTQVKPEFIICCGMSGQVQHIGGINKSKLIIAVNKDKAAPIFKNCDFGLVGDMYKIIPALTEKLQ